MEGGTYRVELTFDVGVGSPDNERFGRAVDKLVRVLPDGSRLLRVGDAPTGGPGVIEVAASVPAAGRSSAQALRDVARAVDLAAVAAAGIENLPECCRRAVVERLPD
jgi:hypothetical protein